MCLWLLLVIFIFIPLSNYLCYAVNFLTIWNLEVSVGNTKRGGELVFLFQLLFYQLKHLYS